MSAQQNKKARQTTTHATLLIDFFGDDRKEVKTQTEKRNIHNCKEIVLTKNWFVISNF